MPMFSYRAVDAEGTQVEGVMEEASARRVVLALETQGMKVNSVEESGSRSRLFRSKPRLTWSDLEQFNDQLLTITRGSLPLAPSLEAMARDLRNPRLKKVLDDLRRDVETGLSLEEAMNRQPESFPPIYRVLVRAGERAGNLAAVFSALSGYSKRMVALRSDIQIIMTYPFFLCLAAVGLVYFLMVRVVPVFAEIFRDFGGRLPAPTQLLVDFSDFVTRNGFLIACGFIVLILLGLTVRRLTRRTESGSLAGDWLKSMLPIFGRVYHQASLARFCRPLKILLDARVPILESLQLAAASSGNAVLEKAVARGAERIAAGATLADALEETGYFDNGFCWLLRNAEQRGAAPQALDILQEEYERSLDRMRKSILLMIGPVVAVVIGLIVGFIVLSLYLPIFSLGDVVSGS